MRATRSNLGLSLCHCERSEAISLYRSVIANRVSRVIANVVKQSRFIVLSLRGATAMWQSQKHIPDNFPFSRMKSKTYCSRSQYPWYVKSLRIGIQSVNNKWSLSLLFSCSAGYGSVIPNLTSTTVNGAGHLRRTIFKKFTK